MWSELKRLKSELDALKRPTTATASASIDIDVDPQVRSNVQQLRSANSTQLRTANVSQLSVSAKPKKQLSSATITHPRDEDVRPSTQATENQNALTIHPTDHHDPLQDELNEVPEDDNVDESSEEENGGDEDMFQDIVNSIDIRGDEEIPGEPVPQIWADKINLAWRTKIGKTAHSSLMQKYRTPSNLDALKVPQMNNEVWKLCNKWQKKADLNMSASQRTLIKVVSAVLGLQNVFGNSASQATKQIVFQTTADIVSLLGKVNRELSSKRKISARPALVGDYKSLAVTTKESEENLFGDTLTQDIKDVNIRRKIGEYPSRRREWRGNRAGRGGYRAYNNTYNNNAGDSFLWRGRGRNRQDYRTNQNQNQRQNNY